MSLANGPARIMAVAALMALLLGPMLFGASPALAQGAPANYYGGGLTAGDTVTASVGDAECGSATADASGGWLIRIAADNDCGAVDGATVNFAVNGEAAEQSVTYAAGGTPENIATGITLTVEVMEEPDDGMGDGMDDGMDDDKDSMTPPSPDTGNAGLVTQSGTSALAVLALGVLALAGVAGARTVTGRID